MDSEDVVTLRHLRSYVATAEAVRRSDLLADLDRRADRALAAWAEDGNSAIGRFRHSAELVRQEELERLARRYPEIGRETLEAITRTLTNKLLHAPSMRMRNIDDESAELVADIFEHQPGVTTRWQD
jgi:glutamyl-tRNA reductase